MPKPSAYVDPSARALLRSRLEAGDVEADLAKEIGIDRTTLLRAAAGSKLMPLVCHRVNTWAEEEVVNRG